MCEPFVPFFLPLRRLQERQAGRLWTELLIQFVENSGKDVRFSLIIIAVNAYHGLSGSGHQEDRLGPWNLLHPGSDPPATMSWPILLGHVISDGFQFWVILPDLFVPQSLHQPVSNFL